MATATTTNQTKAAEFDWRRWPETDVLVDELTRQALDRHAFARGLAERMAPETGTIFQNWLDHFVVVAPSSFADRLTALGYFRTADSHGVGVPVFAHAGGLFPRIAVAPGNGEEVVREVGIKVESVAAFSGAHHLGLRPRGYPMGPLRTLRVPGEGVDLVAVERRAYLGFETFPSESAREGRMKPHAAREALAARDLWLARQRRFDDDAEGYAVTEALVDEVIETAGSRDLACHLIFEVEREYWQARNRAARVQKARQDRLGLGWANHDHHTFRSSRRFFPNLMRIFTKLGFKLRERFHAGADAGWGAQVLEHPVTGIVIFADLDLSPQEAAHDFARQTLPDLPKLGTVGLWTALHGESMLEAGMHHLEAQFEFDALRDGLKAEAGIETMKPFSDFPFLRQAFTAGERWPVSPKRADRALAAGWITSEQRDKFVKEGAIGSHLENLQRREGYKGFNQQAVSAILNATDPRLH